MANKKAKEKRGVLLIALGHPQYGKMAYTLAASIKHSSPDMPIHLVYTDSAISHLSEQNIGIFDTIAVAPKECYYRNKNMEYIKAKSWMYELSPFDTTIFLDVDMIWLTLKPIAELFDSLADVDYTIQNRDHIDLSDKNINPKYSQWANVLEIKEAYGFKKGRYYSLHSEFVYFKKTKENKKFFDEYKYQYDNLKVNHTIFANGIPDELPLSIATVIHEKYPHEEAFLPIYWERAEKTITRNELINNYYGYSIGGNRITISQESTYNDIAKYYSNRRGDRYPFKTTSKISYLKERESY